MASFDVVVIGGGHAGIEAAHAAARLGCGVALCVLSVESVGLMPCNPAIGGTAKGHLVREIDALGGLMGRAIDATGIQFKLLNRSRGPAVWSPRAQADKKAYGRWMQAALAAVPGIAWVTTPVEAIDVGGGVACGVRLASGEALSARAVVLTTGTFLDGVIHVGREQTSAGRHGEPASRALAASLRGLGILTRRLKTGTPPRVHRASVDTTRLEVSRGDESPVAFSFTTGAIAREQVVCFNTRTTARSHAIVREAIGQSPLYNGQISGIGPRYCPSLEDKVMRFEERESHQVVLEPEGLDVDEVYLNGMSMSLPRDVQELVVRSLAGLEGARLLRHGYAVEYDAVCAEELDSSLQSRRVPGLWLAGQVNGTSGYEEAAAQGMVAGINAARSVRGESVLVLGRQDAYIGVLVNDLSSGDQLEPYRMFTSRAEHRLLLRADNADLRLTPIGRRLGLVDDARWAVFEARRARLDENRRRLESTRILVGGVRQRVRDVVKRQDVRLQALVDEGRVDLVRGPVDGLELLGLESDIKYEGYLKRHEREHQRANEQMTTPIPASLDLSSLPGLSRELRQRLSDRRPASLADARSVPGMTPAALALIGMHARRSQEAAGGGES